MARTTYQAPGVYVEEVPSAQQPIAGVGTNTAGFIGVVPKSFKYPVSNERYDPELATHALNAVEGDPQRTQAKISELDREIVEIESEIAGLETEIENGNTQLNALQEQIRNAQGDQRRELEDQKTETRDSIQDFTIQANNRRVRKDEIINNEKPRLEQALRALKTLGAKQELARPYRLETFPPEGENLPNPGETILCTNFSEYTKRFGSFPADDRNNPGHRALVHAVYGFFRNGGTRCYVARVNDQDNLKEIRQALTSLESIDEVAILAAPGVRAGRVTWDELVSHCSVCEDRFAILDCPADVESDGGLDIDFLNYNIDGKDKGDYMPSPNKNAAYYFPYIEVMDPAKLMIDQDPARQVKLKYRGRVHVPPSGHIAGIYARTDEERGVHKAPANCAVLGALNVKYYIGKPKQELLNPQGVNCIRNLNGSITVWGARTIGGDKNGEWKYVNVRRLFLFLAESIDEGTQWVVFEPNDSALWGKIRRNVTAFLTNVWRSGALFGMTPEEAFYVKCDAETNPPEVRELGQVVTEIGVSIVRPAEFVIFRITQFSGPRPT